MYYTFLLLAIAIGVTSCNNEEDEKIMLQDITKLSEVNKSNSVIFINGKKQDKEYAQWVLFTVLDTISKDNDEIYEANMELTLPGSFPLGLDRLQFTTPIFHVKATSSEESIIFSGNWINAYEKVNYSIEGYLKPETLYTSDTLHINIERTIYSPSFAGNTYELTLDENTFNFSDFVDNEPIDNRRIDDYGKEGMLLYIEHLKEMTNKATYRLTFLDDGTLNIQKKDVSMTDFESIPGEFNYYMIQRYSGRGKGIIELPFEIAQKFDTLLKGDVIPGSMGRIYTSITYPWDKKAIIPFTCIDQFDKSTGLFMLTLGDWGSENFKLIGPLSEWRAHSTNYDYTLRNEAIDVFINSWSLNKQIDNLWWNLKRI